MLAVVAKTTGCFALDLHRDLPMPLALLISSSDHLWTVCVCVCVCVQRSHTSFFDWVLVLILGYILQLEEIAHKRVHYYYYTISC